MRTAVMEMVTESSQMETKRRTPANDVTKGRCGGAFLDAEGRTEGDLRGRCHGRRASHWKPHTL